MPEPRSSQPNASGGSRFGYRCNAYAQVLARVARFARNATAPILLEGESGTGKTYLARWIHDLSPRAHRAFYPVPLSALDDSLASSALFGHVVGAFTDARVSRAGAFVSASGGSLFLDEIGKASLVVQNRLLHAIEARTICPLGTDREVPVDVRIIAASNIALAHLVLEGGFLPDLYARLDIFRVGIPPLRERRADIPILAREAVARHAPACGYTVLPEIDAALVTALQLAPWPNNLRQLDATVHRLLVEADGADSLTLALCVDNLAYLRGGKRSRSLTPSRVERALAQSDSQMAAAAVLGVDRTTLYRYLRRRAPPSASV